MQIKLVNVISTKINHKRRFQAKFWKLEISFVEISNALSFQRFYSST